MRSLVQFLALGDRNEGSKTMKVYILEFSSPGLEIRLSKLYDPGSYSKDLLISYLYNEVIVIKNI